MREEVWKDVIGYEGRYQVSNNGRVKSLARLADPIEGFGGTTVEIPIPEKIMAQSTVKGYKKVCLNKQGVEKSVSVHRLVAIAFIPNPDNKRTVNHKNGIKKDNWVENLEWNTYSENIRHAVNTGLKPTTKGEAIGTSKLDEIQVLTIRSLADNREMLQPDIAKYFGVSVGTIETIKARKTW